MRSITRKSLNFDASKATFKTIMDRNTYFQNRGTCRHFKDIDIADATIEDIAQQAMHAPNTGNMQFQDWDLPLILHCSLRTVP